MRKLFIFLGIIFLITGLYFSFSYKSAGCGVCGGSENNYQPIVTSLNKINQFKPPSEKYCMLAGCTTRISVPVFFEIYFAGILLFVLSFIFKKNVKK